MCVFESEVLIIARQIDFHIHAFGISVKLDSQIAYVLLFAFHFFVTQASNFKVKNWNEFLRKFEVFRHILYSSRHTFFMLASSCLSFDKLQT